MGQEERQSLDAQAEEAWNPARMPESDFDTTWLEQQPAVQAAGVLRLLEGGAFAYPDSIKAVAKNIQEQLAVLHDIAKAKGDKDFSKHATRMYEICTELQAATTKNADDRTATIREFWNLIKTSPAITAKGLGHTMQDLATPKFGEKENPFIEIFAKLAQARDDIQNTMRFKPLKKTRKEYTYEFSEDRGEEIGTVSFPTHVGIRIINAAIVISGVAADVVLCTKHGVLATIGVALGLIMRMMTCVKEINEIKTPIPEPDKLKEWQNLAAELKAKETAQIK